jgi:threonine/homoserine/homoserine lactone efflux protein
MSTAVPMIWLGWISAAAWLYRRDRARQRVRRERMSQLVDPARLVLGMRRRQ